MIPESFIDELKYRCDIERTISAYVSLKKAGRTYKGLCPFHSEKSPSFTVYPENGSFYCYGCGAGGDVINFIRRIENLEYIEALKFLAEKNSIPFPESDIDDSTARLKKQVYEINREAARFFHANLRSAVGKDALEYLLNRGVSGKTIGKFGIGFAIDSWDALKKHLTQKGFSEYAIVSASLATMGQNGKRSYDVFRNRIIFPIMDLRGNVIGFGGRVMGEGGPKYLNSADTPVFKKSRNLFALNIAKATKQSSLILAEGYMDVIAMHQAGFDNAVATLGTALTPEQARIISNYTTEVIIAYDSDEAGQKAAVRAVKLFDELGTKVKIVTIPNAKDPDEFIKKFGKDRFKLVLERGSNAFEYTIQKLELKYDLATPDGKIAFLGEFCAYLALSSGIIERDVYIAKISDKLGVERETIKAQINSIIKKQKKKQRDQERKNIKLFSETTDTKVYDPQRKKYIKYALAEDMVMGILIKNPDYFKSVENIPLPSRFITDSNRAIYDIIYSRLADEQSVDITNLGQALSDEQISHLSRILAKVSGMSFDKEQLEEYINTICSFDILSDTVNIVSSSDEELLQYINNLGQKKK